MQDLQAHVFGGRGFFSTRGGPCPALRNRPAPALKANQDFGLQVGAEKFRSSGYRPGCQAIGEEVGPPGKKNRARQPTGESPRGGGPVALAPGIAGAPKSAPGSASALQLELRTRCWSGHLHPGVRLEAGQRVPHGLRSCQSRAGAGIPSRSRGTGTGGPAQEEGARRAGLRVHYGWGTWCSSRWSWMCWTASWGTMWWTWTSPSSLWASGEVTKAPLSLSLASRTTIYCWSRALPSWGFRPFACRA